MSSITDSHVDVKVTPVSGHSMSHRNTLTGKVGTLIPVLVEEVCPNSRMHLQTSFSVKLPPLASETFANIDYRLAAFLFLIYIVFSAIQQLQSSAVRTDSVKDCRKVHSTFSLSSI